MYIIRPSKLVFVLSSFSATFSIISLRIDTSVANLAFYFSYIILLDIPFWMKFCVRIFLPLKISPVSTLLFFFIQFIIYVFIVTLISGGDILLFLIKELWFLLMTIYFFHGLKVYGVRYYTIGVIVNVAFAIYQLIAKFLIGLPSEFFDFGSHYFWNGISVAESYFYPLARFAGLALEPAYLSSYLFPLLFMPFNKIIKFLICIGLILSLSMVTMIGLLAILLHLMLRRLYLDKYSFLLATSVAFIIIYTFSDMMIFWSGSFFDRFAPIVTFKNYNLFNSLFGVGFQNFSLFGSEYYNSSDVIFLLRDFRSLALPERSSSLSLYGALLTESGLFGFVLFSHIQNCLYRMTLFKDACIIFLFSNLTITFTTSWPNIPFMVAIFLLYREGQNQLDQKTRRGVFQICDFMTGECDPYDK
jgi:hypothetical protein